MNIFMFLLIALLVFIIAETIAIGYMRLLIYSIIGILLSVLATITYTDELCTKKQFTQFRDKTYPDFSTSTEYQHWLIDHPKRKDK